MHTVAPTALKVSHYRVTGSLGVGGMGEVYGGVDETLRRRVALKAIKTERRLDPDAKTRFLREARILSQLDHPNICRVYDYIEAPECDWLVLELIEGETLSSAIKRGLAFNEKLRIAQQIAQVLVATHAIGVVHLDLKPGNVMLTRAGDVKVLDFGLSAATPTTSEPHVTPEPARIDVESVDLAETQMPQRAATPALAGDSLFQTAGGVISGTVAYMSPEQARGELATTASDMYSFGLVLQELMTGEAPYEADSDYAEVLARAQRGETRHPTGLSADLTALLRRLKSVTPAARPTAVDTAERLRWIADAPRRRIRNLAIAAAVLMTVGGIAKYTFDLSRERSAAVAAREEADRRRDQAEGLIGFMLGDLRAKLTAVGRLEILDDVGQRALAYFAAVPVQELSGEELFRRSQAMHQLGQVHQARGDFENAARSYDESLAQARDLVARDPANPEWQLALGTSHFYVGDLSRRRGDLDAALTHFRAYQDIARRLVERDPNHPEWLLELSYGYSNVAAVLQQQGDWQGAREQLDRTGAIQDQLLERRPDDATLLMSRANNHNRLGIVLERLGELASAEEKFERELQIYDRLSRANPRDARAMRRVGVSRLRLALTLHALGRSEEALAQMRQAREDAAALVALDPTNAEWQRDHTVSHVWLGRLLLDSRAAGQAKPLLQDSLTSLEVAAASAQAAPRARVDLARARLGLGEALHVEKRFDASAREVDAAMRLLTPLLTDPAAAGTDATLLMAHASNLRGQIWDAAGERQRALGAWQRSVQLLEPLAKSGGDYNALDPLVRALLFLQNDAEAATHFQRLTAVGYRNPALLTLWNARRTSTLSAPGQRD